MDEADRTGGGFHEGRHRLPLRVYYEDTDAGGVIYHASYLRFFERGRSEALRLLGVDQPELLRAEGLLFVVRRIEIDYLAPGRLDDLLHIDTVVLRMGGASLDMLQEARRGDSTLARARVVCVGVGREGRAARLPESLRKRIAAGFPALTDGPDPS
ncbi:tol-pal system-associated acyl-CoA thioesterase [Neomegalonema sp.]|uniref:tol-pal system-associated acyl-CoA thioesterase n=1 Tax=Neomegalonema sp. TaxID=2039713 RepID=UPI0026300D9A|nr:tol-pal system-associated acyl-CoA thioesterase [Neomegalonema sp.]MDD2868270.1 tol-pal system-associated acyl-CoA thioesterase [Neomegalonema sp.]